MLTAEEFISSDIALAPVEGATIVETLTHNLGSFINAAALITVVLLVLLLGLRPAMRMILETKPEPAQLPENMPAMMSAFGPPDTEMPAMAMPLGLPGSDESAKELVAAFSRGNSADPMQQRLEELVSRDSEKATKILKEWLAEPKKSAA